MSDSKVSEPTGASAVCAYDAHWKSEAAYYLCLSVNVLAMCLKFLNSRDQTILTEIKHEDLQV